MSKIINRVLLLSFTFTEEEDRELNEAIKCATFTLTGKDGKRIAFQSKVDIKGNIRMPDDSTASTELGDTVAIGGWGDMSGAEDLVIEAIGDVSDAAQLMAAVDEGAEFMIGRVIPGTRQVNPNTVVNARIKKQAAKQNTYAQAAKIRDALDVGLNPCQDVTIAAGTAGAQWSTSPVETGTYVGARIRCVRGTNGVIVTKLEVNSREQRILSLKTNGSAGAGLTVGDGLRAVPREGGDVLISLPPANYSQSDVIKFYLSNDDGVNSAMCTVQLLRQMDMPGKTDNLSS